MNNSKATLRVEGIPSCQKALRSLAVKAAGQVVRDAARTSMLRFVTLAQELVPVKTGRLRRSIKRRMGKRKRGRVSVVVGILAKQLKSPGQAAAQEYGAVGTSAHHFLKRAFDEGKSDVLADTLKRLHDGIQRVAAEVAQVRGKG